MSAEEIGELRALLEEEREAREKIAQWISAGLKPLLKRMNDDLTADIANLRQEIKPSEAKIDTQTVQKEILEKFRKEFDDERKALFEKVHEMIAQSTKETVVANLERLLAEKDFVEQSVVQELIANVKHLEEKSANNDSHQDDGLKAQIHELHQVIKDLKAENARILQKLNETQQFKLEVDEQFTLVREEIAGVSGKVASAQQSVGANHSGSAIDESRIESILQEQQQKYEGNREKETEKLEKLIAEIRNETKELLREELEVQRREYLQQISALKEEVQLRQVETRRELDERLQISREAALKIEKELAETKKKARDELQKRKQQEEEELQAAELEKQESEKAARQQREEAEKKARSEKDRLKKEKEEAEKARKRELEEEERKVKQEKEKEERLKKEKEAEEGKKREAEEAARRQKEEKEKEERLKKEQEAAEDAKKKKLAEEEENAEEQQGEDQAAEAKKSVPKPLSRPANLGKPQPPKGRKGGRGGRGGAQKNASRTQAPPSPTAEQEVVKEEVSKDTEVVAEEKPAEPPAPKKSVSFHQNAQNPGVARLQNDSRPKMVRKGTPMPDTLALEKESASTAEKPEMRRLDTPIPVQMQRPLKKEDSKIQPPSKFKECGKTELTSEVLRSDGDAYYRTAFRGSSVAGALRLGSYEGLDGKLYDAGPHNFKYLSKFQNNYTGEFLDDLTQNQTNESPNEKSKEEKEVAEPKRPKVDDKVKFAEEEAQRKTKQEAERKAKEAAESKAKIEADRKAKEEAEQRQRAEEEAEQKIKEEAERKSKEEADRKAKQEAEKKAKEEANRKAKEESDRRAKEEANRKAKEEKERKTQEPKKKKAEDIYSDDGLFGQPDDNLFGVSSPSAPLPAPSTKAPTPTDNIFGEDDSLFASATKFSTPKKTTKPATARAKSPVKTTPAKKDVASDLFDDSLFGSTSKPLDPSIDIFSSSSASSSRKRGTDLLKDVNAILGD